MYFISLKAQAKCHQCMEGYQLDQSHDCYFVSTSYHERWQLLCHLNASVFNVWEILEIPAILENVQDYIQTRLLQARFSAEDIEDINTPSRKLEVRIIHLFKRKGNSQVCDNYRGSCLLSIAGKILARVLQNRLSGHLGQSGLLPESQCGFRKDRGTIVMIFTARQLQENCQEQNVDLYMTFVELTKAFDTVSRERL